MRKTIDLIGKRFGRLTVIERVKSKGNYAMWKCLCDCGNYTDSRTGDLMKGRKSSCGCLQKETASNNKFIDISGKKFGKLTAIEPIGKTKHNEIIWKCQCDCGKQAEVTGINLRRGKTKSCGCLTNRNLAKIKRIDNSEKSYKRIHGIWKGMKTRCYNSNSKGYKDYGARGILICEEWKECFLHFYEWSINNGYADDLTIDRKDKNGNYEPSNCQWVTMKQQSNNKRNNVKIEYKGEIHTISEWSEVLGFKRSRFDTDMRKYGKEYAIKKYMSGG